jgi:hydrogenase maturation protease
VTVNATTEDIGEPVTVLVLGLGNVLLGDDGLGAAALAHLQRAFRIPPGVRLADGGTLGLALLGPLTEAEHVILVDAVRIGDTPGRLVRLTGDDVIDAVRDRLSPHQVGVADLLDAARLIERYPESVTLLGLVPESIELAVGRSGAVEAGLNTLVAAIVREVQNLGYEMVPTSAGADGQLPDGDLARYFGL